MTKLPAPRKYLSADALFRNVHESFRDIRDPRTGKPDVSLPDALMSGLAVFAFKDLPCWPSTSEDKRTKRTCG